jgi:3-deoxy-manno-octulosonate cytidylyltransferase (CMP-KDO synthetase)
MNTIGIIPARLQSVRFPRKILADLHGKPIIQHVWEKAIQAKSLSKVIIAVDDDSVFKICTAFGAECIMTNPMLVSGTDRIYQAYTSLDSSTDYIVNIQGDEPFINPSIIDELVYSMQVTQCDICTPIVRIVNQEELYNSSIVKVVVDVDYNALYFSRAAIPFIRDIPSNEWISHAHYYKHVGIYCYSHKALKQFVHLPIGTLEQLEKLEQLRMLENNYTIHCCVIDEQIGFGIDNPLDLEKARLLIQ